MSQAFNMLHVLIYTYPHQSQFINCLNENNWGLNLPILGKMYQESDLLRKEDFVKSADLDNFVKLSSFHGML